MAIPQALIDAMNRLDTETNEISAKVAELRDQISTSMTPAEVESVQTQMSAIADRLDGLAKDPQNPVPE
jgi:Asp-tRNA(Asn)/Glu-tRNA(Gln) amidotransferase C subunit